MRESGFKIGKPNGVAMVMVLWVMAILSVMVMEFSFAMRTEVHITRNFKEELQLYAIAEGGMQRAIAEMIYKQDPRVQQMRKTVKEEMPPEKREWVADGRPYLLSYDQGKCDIRVMNEEGKININLISEAGLRRIMRNIGLEDEARDIVVDSIMDWRDPDDFYRINGAENDYYRSLPEPYDCKNGPLDAIEELLLVKGVTPDLFYGRRGPKKEGEKPERSGLKDIFSLYSSGEQIDINSAAAPALRLALGIPGEVSRLIVKAREEKGFDHQVDLLQRVPELGPFIGEVAGLILYRSRSAFYTIESRATYQGGKTKRGIKGIVKIDPREKRGYKIIQWVDSIR
jgi:general secretion pathway protein K